MKFLSASQGGRVREGAALSALMRIKENRIMTMHVSHSVNGRLHR